MLQTLKNERQSRRERFLASVKVRVHPLHPFRPQPYGCRKQCAISSFLLTFFFFYRNKEEKSKRIILK